MQPVHRDQENVLDPGLLRRSSRHGPPRRLQLPQQDQEAEIAAPQHNLPFVGNPLRRRRPSPSRPAPWVPKWWPPGCEAESRSDRILAQASVLPAGRVAVLHGRRGAYPPCNSGRSRRTANKTWSSAIRPHWWTARRAGGQGGGHRRARIDGAASEGAVRGRTRRATAGTRRAAAHASARPRIRALPPPFLMWRLAPPTAALYSDLRVIGCERPASIGGHNLDAPRATQ